MIIQTFKVPSFNIPLELLGVGSDEFSVCYKPPSRGIIVNCSFESHNNNTERMIIRFILSHGDTFISLIIEGSKTTETIGS